MLKSNSLLLRGTLKAKEGWQITNEGLGQGMSGKNTGHLPDGGKSVGHECFLLTCRPDTPRSGFHSISGQHIFPWADLTSNSFSTTPGASTSLDKAAPSSHPQPSLFQSFPLIHSTHTHTHPSPSSPVQISIPAIEKPSPLIPLLNSLNQTPSMGFYNLPDFSFIGVTAVPDCVCVIVVKMLWSIFPAEQSECAFCPPLNCLHWVRPRGQSWHSVFVELNKWHEQPKPRQPSKHPEKRKGSESYSQEMGTI